MCPTSCAGVVIVGITDNIAVVVTVTMEGRNTVFNATAAREVVVGVANYSAIIVTISMAIAWRGTVHCALGTIVVRVTGECETGIKAVTVISSSTMVHYSTCSWCHMNSHCSQVVITTKKPPIPVPSFKL